MPLDYAEQMEEYGFIPFNHQKPMETFTPYLAKVYDHKGNAIPGYQAVLREDSGDTLAIHSDKYALVPYQRHFEAFEHAIRVSNLNATGMRVGTDYADNGAKIFRQYLFPEHTKVIRNKGTERAIALRIYMFDSYDGSTAFQGACGYFDFMCANSAIFGTEVDRVRFRHVGEMETKVADAADRLTSAAERFIENMGRMEKWPMIDLKPWQFEEIAKAMPQGGERLTNELMATWGRYEYSNLWEAQQLLTSWSTHGIPAKTMADRQKRVSALIETKVWKAYEEFEVF